MQHGQMTPQRGQSFMELAIFLPVLFLMLGGMVEVTLTFNDYLQMLDAVRYGARSIADTNPYPVGFPTQAPPVSAGIFAGMQASAYDSIGTCGVTLNTFRVAACNTDLNLAPLINLKSGDWRYKGFDFVSDPTSIHINDHVTSRNSCSLSNNAWPNRYRDDIIVSMFASNVITSTNTIQLKRFKSNAVDGTPLTGHLVEDTTDEGWSYLQQMCSAIKTTDLQNKLLLTAPNTGFAVVEIFYNRSQTFDLPGFGDVIPNPIPMHSYAIFPLVAIEATSTPTPAP